MRTHALFPSESLRHTTKLTFTHRRHAVAQTYCRARTLCWAPSTAAGLCTSRACQQHYQLTFPQQMRKQYHRASHWHASLAVLSFKVWICTYTLHTPEYVRGSQTFSDTIQTLMNYHWILHTRTARQPWLLDWFTSWENTITHAHTLTHTHTHKHRHKRTHTHINIHKHTYAHTRTQNRPRRQWLSDYSIHECTHNRGLGQSRMSHSSGQFARYSAGLCSAYCGYVYTCASQICIAGVRVCCIICCKHVVRIIKLMSHLKRIVRRKLRVGYMEEHDTASLPDISQVTKFFMQNICSKRSAGWRR